MRPATLLRRNLRFHWRANVAVFLGVAVGTAVLTGALLVGDSLRGSLHDVTERQLGWVDEALLAPRFFREKLVDDLDATRKADAQAHPDRKPGPTAALPVIVLQASISADSPRGVPIGVSRHAGKVTVWGVTERFWGLEDPLSRLRDEMGLSMRLPWIRNRRLMEYHEAAYRSVKRVADWRGVTTGASASTPAANVVVLNRPLADELGVEAGDSLTVHLQKASSVPRESLLGHRDSEAVVKSVKLTVTEVLPDRDPASYFNLNPTPAPPRDAFVPLPLLQEKLEQPGRVNGVLVGGPLWSLPEVLSKSLTLDDWGLVLHDPRSRADSLFTRLDPKAGEHLARHQWRDRVGSGLARMADAEGTQHRGAVQDYYAARGYLSLESRQMLLEPAVANAALKVAKEMGWRAAPTLVYLANSIQEGAQSIPYSVVAALDPELKAPLGPFLPAGVEHLKDDEIILAGWKESPLPMKVGDPITLSYFQPEEQGRLSEHSATFRLAGALPLDSPDDKPLSFTVADDPDLTPEFPGITDKLTLGDWNPPFPYDNKRVKKRDEDYWKKYRTTPKAYITLAAGQKLWSSRFGNLTSIRLAPPTGNDLNKAAGEFRSRLIAEMKPEQGGFVFDPVRERALAASGGGMNFGELFLYFSFFLIVAALLLVGLLFRLNLDRRASEIGLLLAAGYRRRSVRRLLLAEGGVIAALGGVLGTVGAIVYAWLLLELLRAWWPGDLDRSLLHLHVTATSLLIGYLSAFVVSLLTIGWAVRILGKISPSALLAGATGDMGGTNAVAPRWSRRVAVAALLGGVILVACGGFVKDHEARAGTFFTGGFLLLTAGLSAMWALLRRPGGPVPAQSNISALGVRNAARHPTRSLLTAGLLASAAFLIVAVESFRREPDKDFLNKSSGSGGFALLAEADLPVFQDLNRGPGRDEITERLENKKIPTSALDNATFFALRQRSGDDASCLNLYQPGRPRLLGVPHNLVERGGFLFADTLATTPEQKANPWLLLETPGDDDSVPVFGEKNTVEWMLKSQLGGTIEVPNEHGNPVKLRIVGLLQDSVFQGQLLMAEANFLRLYPSQEGYTFFLIDVPAERVAEVKGLLETALGDRGFEVTPTAQRLAAYLAVENTYLSTFQALGGLGLLLGALGLAVVMLRGVWERRGELALLRALGFRRQTLGWLVLVENAFLLLVGLGIGVAAALLAVAPHVYGSGADVPWLRLLGLLGLVLIVGLVAGAAAMRSTLRAPLLPALRRE
jgi:ABC-type lipoprotein release transport system permease subunit